MLDAESPGGAGKTALPCQFEKVPDIVPLQGSAGNNGSSCVFTHKQCASIGNRRSILLKVSSSRNTHREDIRMNHHTPDRNNCPVTQVQIHAYGDASRLALETAHIPSPSEGEIRVRHTVIGVNFVDIYHRTGRYALPRLPATLGVEAVGVVDALGPGVTDLMLGQRIAYAGPPIGAYSSARNLPADQAIPLPDALSDAAVAAGFLRGITAHMLFEHVCPVRAGETLLVHAAAGGLGLVLTQWAKALGARVIGTVSTAAKADLARRHGLDAAILYRERHFVDAVLELTDGHGVDYAIDGIGGQTLIDTLAAVRPGAMLASIGQAGGDSEPVRLSLECAARSVNLVRPSVLRFVGDRQRYREGAAAALARMQRGLKTAVHEVLPLAQAAETHRRLESGLTVGAMLLRP
jgi:NADPH:quinone reductase-like Zn-dependent oxidoreductase